MKTFHRTIRIITVVVFGAAFFIALLAQLNRPVQAAPIAEIDVCATCTYTTIQTAVSAANPGDTIRVAQGTYQDTITATGLLTTTVLITKDLTLVGGYSPDFQAQDPDLYETIVDGQNIAKGFYVSGSFAHIEGFTVINGYTQGILVRESIVNNASAGATLVNNYIHDNMSGVVVVLADVMIDSSTIAANSENGITIIDAVADIMSNSITENNGGIYATRSNVTIEGNQILSNTTAEYGGGIALDSSTQFTVTHNIIRDNQATLYNGGGIATGWEAGSTGIISYNEIVGNRSTDHGGGIIIYESAEVTISHNDIQLNTTQWGGGGIHVRGGSAPVTITNNTLYTNTAEYGAAILIVDTNNEMLISQNDIRFNKITGEDYQPGGIHVDNMGGMVSIINNVLAHNDNRGVKGVNYTEIEMINNTLVDNGTIAVEMHAWPDAAATPMTTTVVNNIIDSHTDCAFFGFNNAVFAVHHNDVVGHDLDDCGATIVSQSENINADPMFVDAGTGNYQLQFGSPAVDSGFAGPGAPNVDIEGVSRPQGSGVDMGAYEAVLNQIFLPMITKPIAVPSNNFMIEDQPFGQGYGAYSGDIHAWVSDTDGWGFAPQDPDNVTFFRWDGTEWNSFQTLPSGGWYFLGTDLKMLSATEGWAVAPRTGQGPPTFFHWNGTQWTEEASTEAGIIAMDFRSSNDGWGVGYWPGCCGAKFYHWDGLSWTEKAYLVSNWPLSDIALLSNGDGWAVGTTIARQSGDSWVVYGSPVSGSLNAISMVTPDDGWIVGEAGKILHWNGTAWTAVASPTTEELWQIEMLQSNHGWAVGDNGTILRWNGTAWSVIASPVNVGFRELDMVDINEGWIPYYDNATSTYGVLHITTP